MKDPEDYRFECDCETIAETGQVLHKHNCSQHDPGICRICQDDRDYFVDNFYPSCRYCRDTGSVQVEKLSRFGTAVHVVEEPCPFC